MLEWLRTVPLYRTAVAYAPMERGRRSLFHVLCQRLIEGANSALSRVILFMSALNLGSVERGNPAPSGWGIARLVAF